MAVVRQASLPVAPCALVGGQREPRAVLWPAEHNAGTTIGITRDSPSPVSSPSPVPGAGGVYPHMMVLPGSPRARPCRLDCFPCCGTRGKGEGGQRIGWMDGMQARGGKIPCQLAGYCDPCSVELGVQVPDVPGGSQPGVGRTCGDLRPRGWPVRPSAPPSTGPPGYVRVP